MHKMQGRDPLLVEWLHPQATGWQTVCLLRLQGGQQEVISIQCSGWSAVVLDGYYSNKGERHGSNINQD